MKIVILDAYCCNPGDLNWDGLEQLGEVTVYERTKSHQVTERCHEADVLIVNKVDIGEEEMSQLPKLRFITVLGTGYNSIDVAAAQRHGIIVSNAPNYSTDSVAQTVFAHLLNVANRTQHYVLQNREGEWSRRSDYCFWNTPLIELSGKTMGIVGLGNIGMRVAQIANAFGMNVMAVTSKQQSDLPHGIMKAEMGKMLQTSDIVSLHCPLTKETERIIRKENLSRMKRGAILINTGRGPLVDETDVEEALQSGHLSAYCADVMCQEPPQKDHPLLKNPHAYVTPHIAWATREARDRLISLTIDNVRAFAEGKPQNVVS